jgi:hypothetical protein
MDPSPTTPPATPAAAVSQFTADDAVAILNTLGTLVATAIPGEAAAVAAITGVVQLIDKTIIPGVQHLLAHEISVVQQAALQVQSAALRVLVGAPPATTN